MHEGLPKSGNEQANGDDPLGFGALESESAVEPSAASPEKSQERINLIREINEQIPFLAYGLSAKIQQNGLGGKVSVRGVMGDSWGVGVSKNNPRKDIPNIVIYPESILAEERSVTNAQLRHEVGNLNHSIGGEMAELAVWCEKNGQSYRLIAPLVEAVQEASVNYLEMRNSISDDPAAAFRPLYEKVIPVKDIAEKIGSDLEYKQAVDMTLLKSLNVAGLVDSMTLDAADDNLSDDVKAAFSKKTSSVIEQAVKTSSGKIRVQLVRDYLWPEFSKFVPSVSTTNEVGAEDQLTSSLEHASKTPAAQRALDILEKNQKLSPKEQNERAAANAFLSGEIEKKADELSRQLSSLGSENQSEEAEKKQSENIQEQLEKLQSLLDGFKNPEKASSDDLEGLQFKINEVGINESDLNEGQLKLLNNLRDFCRTTTAAYVRTMRFIMEEYKSRNPNFTDAMMEKMILRGHDTPSFTIYGKEAGKDFIENTCPELGFEDFESNGMVLNFNLPDILGRFWYRGGVGAKAQSVPDGAIEWGHFYRSGMPAIWRSVDVAPRKGIFLDRLNAFGQHDYKKYYYLYDVMGLDIGLGSQQESGTESGEQDNSSAPDADSNGESDNDTGGQSQNGGTNEEERQGMQKQLSDILGDLESLTSKRDGGDNQALMDALSKAIEEALSDSAMPGRVGEENNNADIDGDANKHGGGGSQSDEEYEWGAHSERTDLSVLFNQLRETQEKLESSFSDAKSEQGGFREYNIDDQDIEPDTVESIDNLESIKAQQERQMEAFYREQSGLSGEALDRYIGYREETRTLTDDLVVFFTEKFNMDTDYTYENNQRRGKRLQRGWTSRILGRTALGTTAIEPEVFERRSIPKKPNFTWSIIVDNSGSTEGEIIEQERKTSVALVEVAKQLNIPLEILVFQGGEGGGFRFLKTFNQELVGDDLSKLVQLDANTGNSDAETLQAACQSMTEYADQFNRSYNFLYFLTDGLTVGAPVQPVIEKFKRDIVITGIGLAGAADTINKTFGKNSVGVEDVSKLSDTLIRKIEDQIEETFD